MNLFSLIIAAGAGLGLYGVYRAAPAGQAIRRVDAAVLVLLCALAGARAGYVLSNLTYFTAYPADALRVWLGGLDWAGALAGWLLGVGLAALLWREPLLPLADALAGLLPPVAVAAWLGCWQAGCGYAPPAAGSPWWAVPAPDGTGLVAPRFPLQPMLAAAQVAGFALAQALASRARLAGLRAALLATIAAGAALLI